MNKSKVSTAILLSLSISLMAQNTNKNNPPKKPVLAKSTVTKPTPKITPIQGFDVDAGKFGDAQVLRYQVPGFETLPLKQKQLAYYLYEAALCGRDMIYDQKYKNNLKIRKTIEAIYETYKGDRKAAEWNKFMDWAKRFWFSNGIHHHYGSDKMMPEISAAYLSQLIQMSDSKKLPLNNKISVADFTKWITPILLDPNVDKMTVDLSDGVDNIVASSNNFYEGVTEEEVDNYYKGKIDANNEQQISWGLNSKMKKVNGEIVELPWKVGGMYTKSIEKIVYWLEKAKTVAENEQQAKVLGLLIDFYKTGDLRKFDEYNIEWVKDVNSTIDVVNGFIEVYQDAVGKRGSFESVVSMKDFEATKKIEKIAKNAQWFEDNSPLMPEHKKKEVKGIIGKAITVIVESGDAAPTTPIGINLPNSNWIRQQHGSKSVSLNNIVESYNIQSAKSPTMSEFAYDKAAIERAQKYGALAGELHTDMHEVIGHASGQLNKGVSEDALKNYKNALEEARADLVALYYIYDQKLVDLGVMPSLECGMAEFDNYILNGLMLQLNRIEEGKNIEEAHMRNRQLVAKWAYEMGKKDNVIEMVKRDNKTYIKINDYAKLRELFGQLLREIQRIKSEGDFNAGKNLIETYAVKVDQEIWKEVKERFKLLNVAPYKGFVQPKLVPVMVGGKIADVKIEYPKDFVKQMMEYGKQYGLLPVEN